MQKIGFIGIGLMGGPLARNLIRAGKQVYIYARNQDKLAATLQAGTTGHGVATPEELADCDIIFTCLPLPQTIREVMLGENGLLAKLKSGAIYIDTSTIDPETAREVETFSQARGISFLGCTLGKGPAQAETATEPMFVGGNKAIFEQVLPLLSLIGSPIHYLGGVEQAYAFKIISNMVGMTNVAVLSEGIHLAKQAHIEPRQFLELLADTGGDSGQLHTRGPWIISEDFANRFAVDLALKDLTLGDTMATNMGYHTELAKLAQHLYTKASKAGYGQEDCCAVYKILDGKK